jgi:hypothetical protein
MKGGGALHLPVFRYKPLQFLARVGRIDSDIALCGNYFG